MSNDNKIDIALRPSEARLLLSYLRLTLPDFIQHYEGVDASSWLWGIVNAHNMLNAVCDARPFADGIGDLDD